MREGQDEKAMIKWAARRGVPQKKRLDHGFHGFRGSHYAKAFV